MFCNQCRTELQPDYNVCPKCGAPVGNPVPVGIAGQGRLERHLPTLGTLWMVVGVLFLIPSVGLLTAGGFVHFAIPGARMMARAVGPLVLYVIGASFLVLAAGGICVGWGLRRREPWARVAALILGFLALFHPPAGTTLGIYTLWVLMANHAGTEYERMAKVA